MNIKYQELMDFLDFLEATKPDVYKVIFLLRQYRHSRMYFNSITRYEDHNELIADYWRVKAEKYLDQLNDEKMGLYFSDWQKVLEGKII